MAGTLTRRQALAAGALGAVAALAGGAGLVQAGVLPGRYRAGRLLGPASATGSPGRPGPVRATGCRSSRCTPPATSAPPFDGLRLHHHLAQAVGAAGAQPFALASADGRDSGWRPTSGDDPVGMVTEERLPLLSGLGLRTGPGSLGVLGWSAGGAAALRLAEAGPGRLAAVAAASPAVTGAGPEVAAAGRLAGTAVRVDCGANDPFAVGARALAASLPGARVTVAKGCHDGAFGQRVAPAQLRFLADALGGGPNRG
jgi:pimeloyl-ACP methyl ester carboxylesterase